MTNHKLKLTDDSDTEIEEPKEIEPFIFHTIQHKKLPSEEVLLENVVTDGVPPEKFAKFIFPMTVPIARDHKGNPIEVQSMVSIPGKTLAEAFNNIKEHSEAAWDTIRQQGIAELNKARKPQIVVPGINAPLTDHMKFPGT